MKKTKPAYLYKNKIMLEPVGEDQFEIRGIRRKKAWLPEVEVPGINDVELCREHEIELETLEEVVTVLVSAGRKISPALNKLLNERIRILKFPVFEPNDQGSFGSYRYNDMTLRIDYVTARCFLEAGEQMALLGLWAHEVGHALTIPEQSQLQEKIDKYSHQTDFKEREALNGLFEDWAEEVVYAIEFGEELKALENIPYEIREKIYIERGFLE